MPSPKAKKNIDCGADMLAADALLILKNPEYHYLQPALLDCIHLMQGDFIQWSLFILGSSADIDKIRNEAQTAYIKIIIQTATPTANPAMLIIA